MNGLFLSFRSPEHFYVIFLVDRKDQSLRTEPNLQFLMSPELHPQQLALKQPVSCRRRPAGIKKKQVSHFTAKPGEHFLFPLFPAIPLAWR